jgi:hypothetical protein
MKNTIIKFGEDVDGYSIPVLNEREIRAAAGILFVAMFMSLMLILFNGNFLMIKYLIIFFLCDLMVRVFINPKFSPSLIIGRLIVSNQTPEYVGAAQKKFAWKIGIAFAGLMFFLLVVVNSYSILTGLTCLICLVFLFFESAFGICLGCLVYGWFHKDKSQYCVGESCNPTKKQDIQKTSWIQIIVLLGAVALLVLAVFLFNDQFSEKPKNLWNLINSF